MRTLDLYAADFPHGSRKGYDMGCRGAGACPNHLDSEFVTCREAFQLAQGDYEFRSIPADQPIARAKPADVAPEPPAEKPAPIPAPVPSPVVQAAPIPTPPGVEVSEKRKAGRPLAGHGTYARWQRGCKTDAECPNFGLPGEQTCRDAYLEYSKNRSRRRRAAPERPSEEEIEVAVAEVKAEVFHQIHESTEVANPATEPSASARVTVTISIPGLAEPIQVQVDIEKGLLRGAA